MLRSARPVLTRICRRSNDPCSTALDAGVRPERASLYRVFTLHLGFPPRCLSASNSIFSVSTSSARTACTNSWRKSAQSVSPGFRQRGASVFWDLFFVEGWTARKLCQKNQTFCCSVWTNTWRKEAQGAGPGFCQKSTLLLGDLVELYIAVDCSKALPFCCSLWTNWERWGLQGSSPGFSQSFFCMAHFCLFEICSLWRSGLPDLQPVSRNPSKFRPMKPISMLTSRFWFCFGIYRVFLQKANLPLCVFSPAGNGRFSVRAHLWDTWTWPVAATTCRSSRWESKTEKSTPKLIPRRNTNKKSASLDLLLVFSLNNYEFSSIMLVPKLKFSLGHL